MVKDVQHRAFFINTHLQTCLDVEGNVPDEDTETDWNQQHRFKLLRDGEVDEEEAYQNHDQMSRRGVAEAGVGPEVCQVVSDKCSKFSHNALFFLISQS